MHEGFDSPSGGLASAAQLCADELEEPVRVLVVDDDERNLLAIQTVLEELGEIVTARSGEEALRHLLKGEFAVILLDVYMPGMDGYETAQMIRNRDQTKRIPIVFLSAVNKEMEHLLRGYAMGAVDYVFKPVDPIVLRSKVAVFVDLFAKTKEIQRKARQEQALLDATLRANAERLRAEQELRLVEQRQAAIIQSLPILLYLEPLDCDPRCPKFVSGDLLAITGYTFADVLEDPSMWTDRIHEDDRDRVMTALGARARTGRLSVEYRWRCADGSYRHFHDQAVLLKDPHGGRVEFAGTLTDVTEQRSLESRLVQAQKMDAIGKLTGGIAHDFNNLLAAVLGGVGMLERRAELPDEHRKILAMTKRAADQGSELVRRLLAFARRQQLQPASVDLPSLHDGVNDLLTHTLGGLVTLDWQMNGGSWSAYADPSQLELALMNLIINARDAMPNGGTISISAENQTLASANELGLQSGDYVAFAVCDQGCGIPADILEQVMEPFFTTKEVGKGTGLGLSMVYGFARQSGGTVRIQSDVGRGTRAEIWLPRAEKDEPPVRSDDEAGERRPSVHRPLRILLVDDHVGVRHTTAGMLQDLGHMVMEATDGAQALELLSRDLDGFDLLITDYAMPRLSGMEVVCQARDLRPSLPAIIITGYADTREISNWAADITVLSKPFSVSQLSQALFADPKRAATATS